VAGCDLNCGGEQASVASREGTTDKGGWTVAIGAVACGMARS
jgi:hypothetical protein